MFELINSNTVSSPISDKSVRGDFLLKLGRHQEACIEFKRAAALSRNEKEREILLKRASDCAAE